MRVVYNVHLYLCGVLHVIVDGLVSPLGLVCPHTLQLLLMLCQLVRQYVDIVPNLRTYADKYIVYIPVEFVSMWPL